MEGMSSMLNSDMGKQLVGGLSNEIGADQNKTAGLINMAMPVMMAALKKNASNPDTAGGLMNALSSDKHNGSILDNLGDLFSGGVNADILKDGAGILGHVFGDKQQNVMNALSEKSGLALDTISKSLMTLAPIALGFLGKQTRENNVSSPNDLGSMLGSMLGGQSGDNKNLITSLLDADGDGSVMDDVSDMFTEGKDKGGFLGMLGSLFGK